MSEPKELLLTHYGAAQLVRGDTVLWSSLDDEDFRDQMGEDLLGQDDLDDIFDYLVDQGYLTDEEADDVAGRVVEESDESPIDEGLGE